MCRSADGRMRVKSPIQFYGSPQMKPPAQAVRYLWSTAAGSPSETIAGLPKVALDFLLRPARMTSRQHSGTKLSTRRGKLARRRQTTAARKGADMAIWFMRRLQCLFCEEFILSRAEIATDAGSVETPTKIVETTCCARGNVRMR